VERSPSPVALEDRDADELTLEEARELVRRMRTREQAAVKIKKEHGTKRQHPIDLGGERGEAEAEDEEEGDVSITDIITPDMKRARIASSAEVIDLTDE
jgi:hypothetical protein